jgi:hypothetical protein
MSANSLKVTFVNNSGYGSDQVSAGRERAHLQAPRGGWGWMSRTRDPQ